MHPCPMLSEGERNDVRQLVLLLKSNRRLLDQHGQEHPFGSCDRCRTALADIERVAKELEAIAR